MSTSTFPPTFPQMPPKSQKLSSTQTPAASRRTVNMVTTEALYDRWAESYDTDGNILQEIDDLLIGGLLKKGMHLVPKRRPITITELGCGTGRNTLKLVADYSDWPFIIHLNALDLSIAMLQIAEERCSKTQMGGGKRIDYIQFDALSRVALLPEIEPVDLILSTLVLEHLPIPTFFATVKRLLKPRGVAVISNMHADMGKTSRAGFNDEKTGQKVRGTSFAHTIEEIVEGAKKEGFGVYGDIMERAITERDLESGVVGPRGQKWLGSKVWFGIVFKLEGEGR